MSYICFCVYEDDSTLRIQFLRKIAVYILIQERYFLELLTKRLYVIYTYQTGEQIKLRLFYLVLQMNPLPRQSYIINVQDSTFLSIWMYVEWTRLNPLNIFVLHIFDYFFGIAVLSD